MSDNPQHQEFLLEAEDIVDGLHKNLRILQNLSISSNDLDQDIVDELFRGIHTLKGTSSITGFSEITSLSHKLEDLLENMRSGGLKLTPSLIDVLSEGVDLLVRLLADIHDKGREATDIALFLERLHKTIDGQTAHSLKERGESICIDPALLDGLSDIEVDHLKESLRKGSSLYRITACFSTETFDEEIARLRERLTSIGEVIAFIPASGFSHDDPVPHRSTEGDSDERGIVFEILFTSIKKDIQDRIRSAIGDSSVILHDIESIESPRQLSSEAPSADPSSRSITMAVKVDIERLDTLLNNVGEIFLLSDMLYLETKGLKERYPGDKDLQEILKASKVLSRKLSFLRDDLIEVRMVPVCYMFERLSRIITKFSKELSKEIRVEIEGHETKLDKALIEGLADPLMHIVRNAVDHGIESKETRIAAGKPEIGTIWLRAFQKDGRICIEVEDDGGGIDLRKIYSIAMEKGFIGKEDEPDERRLMEILFQPGFSTTDRVSELSGRGVGLDVVARNIASLGGMVDVETEKGAGTKFSIILPLTLLITKALIVTELGRNFAIPFNFITENFKVYSRDIKRMREKEVFYIRGQWIPLIRLKEIFRFSNDPTRICSTAKIEYSPSREIGDRGGAGVSLKRRYGPDDGGYDNRQYIVVVGLAERRAGIVVDAIQGEREILIKPVSELLGTVPGVTGFTEIDSMRILPVLDVGWIIERCRF